MSSCCSCPTSVTKPKFFVSTSIIALILIICLLLERIGLFSLVSVNSSSSLLLFFLFGLLAGLSTCSTTVGALIISVAQQGNTSVFQFTLGRLISFLFFGAILGYFGSFFHLSLEAGAAINVAVALVLIFIALQMLQITFFQRFKLPSLPIFSRYPIIVGALTCFLPCGFTLTSQSLALASGNVFGGSLIMTAFALGTSTPLTLIGLGRNRLAVNPNFSAYFSQVTGLLILIFSFYTLFSQLSLLGFIPSYSSAFQSDIQPQQLLQMAATASGYSPNYFKIRAGQPIRWEITDRGTSGCTNAIIARQLFTGPINLVPGTTSVKEFTAPATPGTYRFSCWMGMISGTIEVVN